VVTLLPAHSLQANSPAYFPSKICTTAGAASSAQVRSFSGPWTEIGWGTSTNGNSGYPWLAAMPRPDAAKGSVRMTAAGSPACSSKIPSSKLPDEQEPQSPIPAITKSHPDLSSATISGLTPLEACSLLLTIRLAEG
jgi:hypothetical protein